MNIYEIESSLNRFLQVADSLDQEEGAGIKLLSGGISTTRDALKNELGLFLLSLTDGFYTVTNDQAELLDLLLDKGFAYADPDEVLQMASSMDSPYGGDNVSVNAFALHDAMTTLITHKYTTDGADALVGLFRTMGTAILSAGTGSNPLGQMRFEHYIDHLESKAISARGEYRELAESLVKARDQEQAKSAASKPSARKSVSGKTRKIRFDDRVFFSLPDNYSVSETEDDDGSKKLSVTFSSPAGSGKESKDTVFNISLAKSNEPGKDILDEIYDNNTDVTFKRIYDSEPKAIFLMNQTNLDILGVSLAMQMYRLYVRISADEALVIFTTGTGDGGSKGKNPLKQLRDLWKTLEINGRKVKTKDLGSSEISSASRKSLEDETQYDNEVLDNKVLIQGARLRIGDRWEMTIPLGWRIGWHADNDAGFTKLTIYTESAPSGHCTLGNTVGMQKKLNIALNAATIDKTLNAVKFVDNEPIRNDDKLGVSVSCFIDGTGVTIARIMVTEKELFKNETQIDLILTNTIPDFQNALQKLKDMDFMATHPFGAEFENKWMGALRLAASIRPVDEKTEKIPVQAETVLYKGITGCIPDGMKLLKGTEDEADIYYPAKGAPDKEEFLQQKWDCFLKVYPLDGSGIEKREDMARNTQAGLNARFIAHRNRHPAAEQIHECYTSSGYKSLWIDPLQGCVILTVSDGSFDLLEMDIFTETGKSVSDLLKIGKAIYDTVEIDGESECACTSPFPSAAPVLHEHYDLVRSGQYTTRRDADFVGQPICELMEKCGSEGENAYDMMKIPDDTYTLAGDAVSLAKVFRLNEDLFDPYQDREALIRKAMFNNAGAFHALRSLAWSVSSLADQEGKEPGDYSYEELQKIGDIILENNYLSYQPYSYCSGLCSHYDWHVFYVPDEYLEGNESQTTDLRYLTGKENRGGNSVTIVGGFGGLENMHRVSDLISRNEETLASLESLRHDLENMLPVMQTIYNGLMLNRNRSEKLEGPLPDALTAWCALAVAAEKPFYSEEAANTPEADAGMDDPLERPDDSPDYVPVRKPVPSVEIPASVVKPAEKKKTEPALNKPAGKPEAAEKAASAEKLTVTIETNGEDTIPDKKYIRYNEATEVIIPEGVTVIGQEAFKWATMESVVLPKSLRTIKAQAFMNCTNLRSVNFPDGLELIDYLAFDGCEQLQEVHLPDSIQKVNYYTFAKTNGRKGPVIHMSGELARRLHGDDGPWLVTCSRSFVIDGEPQASIKDYCKEYKKTHKPEKKAAGTAPAKKQAPKPKTAPAAVKPMADEKPAVRVLETHCETVIKKNQYFGDRDKRPLEIPEGITVIEQSAFCMSETSSVRFPKSLRIIGSYSFESCPNLASVEIQEGTEEISAFAFAKCPELKIVRLPSTIQRIDRNAFLDDLGPDSDSKITLYIPGSAARRVVKNKQFNVLSAVIAAGFMVDGTWYSSLESYVEKADAEERARIERERAEQRARAERERQERERREAEARRERQKNDLLKQIHDLEAERDAVTGLFAGMKRKKLQKQIDELKGKLSRI